MRGLHPTPILFLHAHERTAAPVSQAGMDPLRQVE